MRESACRLLTSLVLFGGFMGSRTASSQSQAAAVGPGSYLVVGGGFSAFQDNYSQTFLGGGDVFVDLHPDWRYGVEAEARWLNIHSDAAGNERRSDTNYFVGPHINILHGPTRPYVKLMLGEGHIVFNDGVDVGDFFTVAPGGGVEYMLTDRWALRGDFEYQKWSRFPYGSLTPYGVTVGVSFRVNGIPRFVSHASSSR